MLGCAGMPAPRATCNRLGGQAAHLAWIGTATTRRTRPVKFLRKLLQSLVASIPTTSTSGRDTRPRSASALAMARPPSAVPAVEPQLAAGRRERGQWSVRQPLHARASPPPGSRSRMPTAVHSSLSDRTQRGDGDAGILELVAPVEPGGGQIEQPGIVLVDQASALLGSRPVLAGDPGSGLEARRLALDRGQRLARRRHDRRHPAPRMPAFSPRSRRACRRDARHDRTRPA